MDSEVLHNMMKRIRDNKIISLEDATNLLELLYDQIIGNNGITHIRGIGMFIIGDRPDKKVSCLGVFENCEYEEYMPMIAYEIVNDKENKLDRKILK